MKNNKTAISLIVLVITIIVLSILAATVIISLNNTNIIAQASSTVFKSDMSNYKEAYETYVTGQTIKDISFERESLNISYGSEEYDKIFGNVPDKYKEGLKVVNGKLVYETENENEKATLEDLAIASKPLPAGVKEMVDGVPIPTGFTHVAGTAKADGLVVVDRFSNQFVWVPVEGYEKSGTVTSHTIYSGTSKEKEVNLYDSFTNKFKRGSVNTSVTPKQMTGTLDLTSYTEPFGTGYPNESDEYYAMMESVQEYGGFYIARFEAGDETGERTESSGVGTVVSKKGVHVYNWVKWGDSKSGIGTTGAVYLSKKMAEDYGYTSVVSTLCYGVQWDAIMNFVSDASHNIANSDGWGNYNTDIELARFVTDDWL